MATETATIRVSRQTRDRLAKQAHERGVSLAAMLADMAWHAEREAMFAAERAAVLAEADDPEIQQELADWETTTGDGID